MTTTSGPARRLAAGDSDGRSAVLLGAATLLGPLGGFAANIVYARTLGPEGRGDLAAVIAALAVCEAALVFGFPDVLTRHVATRTLPSGALRKVVDLGVFGSVLPAALVSWLAFERGFGLATSLAVGAVVPLATVAALGRGVLAGRRSFRRLMAALVAGGVARIASPAVLVLAHQDEPDLALLLVAASTAVAAVPVLASLPFRDDGGPGVGRFRSLGAQALGIWPASLAWSLNARLDQLVLAALVSPAELGRYAVCVTIAELPLVLSSGLRQVVLVRVAEAAGAGAVPRLTGAVVVAGGMSAVIALALGDPVMEWVFGPAFGDTAVVLAALLLTSAFVISAGLLNSCLIAVGRGRWTLASQSAGLVVSVTLLVLVIPNGGGIEAAAAISTCASACIFLVSLVLVRRLDAAALPEGSPGR